MEAERDVPLFAHCHNLKKALGTEPAKYASFKGAAAWASTVVGRKLTYKEMSRNVAMTKLANSELSKYDSCAYMHVQPKILEKYHKTSAKKRDRASEILNQSDDVHAETPQGDMSRSPKQVNWVWFIHFYVSFLTGKMRFACYRGGTP